MSIQAARAELESITKEQDLDHSTESLNDNIVSNFFSVFLKSTWYSSVLMKLQASENSLNTDSTVSYAVSDTFHFLIYSYLTFRTPSIKVKPEYKGRVRIAWPHNLGTNITPQASFVADDDEVYQTWDNVWADIYFQFYQSAGAGQRESHNKGIGNMKCLEEWSEHLPSCHINVDQPWFYSMDPALAFPIFYKGSQIRAKHNYKFRLGITDLLRVQIKTPSGWKDATSKVNRSMYLDMPKNEKIQVPELWARYSYNRENELKQQKCDKVRTIYTRDVVICDAVNPVNYGSSATLELQSKRPCLAFFWVAENRDATNIRNFSNYTTNKQDLYDGWDPIKTNSFTYGTQELFKDMPSHHFTVAPARKHFPSSPDETGYHAYAYAWNSTSIHGDVGIIFEGLKANLVCHIADTNIWHEDTKDDNDEMVLDAGSNATNGGYKKTVVDPEVIAAAKQDFILRARMLVVRKFVITMGDDGKATFTIK